MTDRRERVVVGVDCSEHSARALEWAVAHAGDAQIEVVTAWSLFEQLQPDDFSPVFNEEQARARVEAFIATTLGEQRPRDLVLTLVNDLAARAILERAHDADLVVVGSRGHGGFLGLLVGSVSDHVVHHADCPVVVARPSKRRSTADAS
jgi:nucleotide-binding universal stress UspA family protein